LALTELYLGLMSGTSLDGVDGVLVEFTHDGLAVIAGASAPMPPALRQDFLDLNQPGQNELHRAALAANALARAYAGVVGELLKQANVFPAAVRAIGAHGQTVRHQPQAFDGTGYTLQLNNPALLAELCGIDVIADFRSRDVAAGGQGAPLVSAFHRAVFGRPGSEVAVLNLGGMANLTVLGDEDEGDILGFDCGPGNVLLDAWCLQHRGEPFDRGGAWAASGQVNAELLCRMQAEPFFAQGPPKSTGRDLFNPQWLTAAMAQSAAVSADDVQASLAELTAQICADSVRTYAPASRELLVCGGGAYNQHLMRRLQGLLPTLKVSDTLLRGLPPLQVEAAAFAWLARQTVRREPGNLEKVTGARGARVLGAVYPA
jgi:anhydro-N-acetylmuramic acid kinase